MLEEREAVDEPLPQRPGGSERLFQSRKSKAVLALGLAVPLGFVMATDPAAATDPPSGYADTDKGTGGFGGKSNDSGFGRSEAERQSDHDDAAPDEGEEARASKLNVSLQGRTIGAVASTPHDLSIDVEMGRFGPEVSQHRVTSFLGGQITQDAFLDNSDRMTLVARSDLLGLNGDKTEIAGDGPISSTLGVRDRAERADANTKELSLQVAAQEQARPKVRHTATLKVSAQGATYEDVRSSGTSHPSEVATTMTANPFLGDVVISRDTTYGDYVTKRDGRSWTFDGHDVTESHDRWVDVDNSRVPFAADAFEFTDEIFDDLADALGFGETPETTRVRGKRTIERTFFEPSDLGGRTITQNITFHEDRPPLGAQVVIAERIDGEPGDSWKITNNSPDKTAKIVHSDSEGELLGKAHLGPSGAKVSKPETGVGAGSFSSSLSVSARLSPKNEAGQRSLRRPQITKTRSYPVDGGPKTDTDLGRATAGVGTVEVVETAQSFVDGSKIERSVTLPESDAEQSDRAAPSRRKTTTIMVLDEGIASFSSDVERLSAVGIPIEEDSFVARVSPDGVSFFETPSEVSGRQSAEAHIFEVQDAKVSGSKVSESKGLEITHGPLPAVESESPLQLTKIQSADGAENYVADLRLAESQISQSESSGMVRQNYDVRVGNVDISTDMSVLKDSHDVSVENTIVGLGGAVGLSRKIDSAGWITEELSLRPYSNREERPTEVVSINPDGVSVNVSNLRSEDASKVKVYAASNGRTEHRQGWTYSDGSVVRETVSADTRDTSVLLTSIGNGRRSQFSFDGSEVVETIKLDDSAPEVSTTPVHGSTEISRIMSAEPPVNETITFNSPDENGKVVVTLDRHDGEKTLELFVVKVDSASSDIQYQVAETEVFNLSSTYWGDEAWVLDTGVGGSELGSKVHASSMDGKRQVETRRSPKGDAARREAVRSSSSVIGDINRVSTVVEAGSMRKPKRHEINVRARAGEVALSNSHADQAHKEVVSTISNADGFSIVHQALTDGYVRTIEAFDRAGEAIDVLPVTHRNRSIK